MIRFSGSKSYQTFPVYNILTKLIGNKPTVLNILYPSLKKKLKKKGNGNRKETGKYYSCFDLLKQKSSNDINCGTAVHSVISDNIILRKEWDQIIECIVANVSDETREALEVNDNLTEHNYPPKPNINTSALSLDYPLHKNVIKTANGVH